MNIFITWTSKWIGKFLKEKLESKYNIFEIIWKQVCDLAKKQDIEKFVNWLPKDLVFDVLILNAGVGAFWNFEENDLEVYENIINVNLLANIRLLKMLEKHINKKTKIIFMGSIIWKKFMKWAAVYQASKFWLRGLAWWLKTEWKKVFIINPKIVDTSFHKDKICINPKWEKTSLESIYEVVNDIILGKESRFEIDL
jgi:short-subunit dehydrogenase